MSLSEKPTAKLTPAEKALDRALREARRPPDRRPAATVDFDPDREPTTIAEARNLQKYWRAKRTELERAVAAGKLVPVERVRQQLAELKTAVLAIPRQAQRRIPTLTDRDVAAMGATLRRVLRRGVDQLAATPRPRAKRGRP